MFMFFYVRSVYVVVCSMDLCLTIKHSSSSYYYYLSVAPQHTGNCLGAGCVSQPKHT